MYNTSLRSSSFDLPNRRRSLSRNRASLPELLQAISSDDLLDRPQSYFLARSETHIVNVDVSLPARPILLLGWASVTVAQAVPPREITTTSWTLTSSRTSKSTVSLTCASADEMFLFMRSLTGVASSKPNARGCLMTGATGWGSWTGGLAFLSCVVCVRGSAARGKRSKAERNNEHATLMRWASNGNVSRGFTAPTIYPK